MQNRISCVKCSVDGELPQKRKTGISAIGLRYGARTRCNIRWLHLDCEGILELLFIPDAHSHRDVFCVPEFISMHFFAL